MFSTMSLVTSIKDYIEVVHKLIETDPNLKMATYYDFGSIITYILLLGKNVLSNVFNFQWFQALKSIPTFIPDIASAMISEISIFDGSFQNGQTIFESPISYGNHNFFIYCTEKFMIGLLNSLFLCLPTSIAHIITLRRFVMQGLEAGFISGLGTIAGNILWIGSILFGFRFVVIPWLSLDLFRYFLGFLLIVKYMWDSYTERRMVLEDLSKYKIFFLTFLLSFTEQTTIYPFLSNLSFGSDSTLLESFPTENFYEFIFVHFSYLLGILLGSLSLLQFTCWFWENPAFQIYMWFISSFKTTTSVYSKIVNLSFLYLTMICAISNIAYFGLDYTLTNPLGFVHEDRLLDQKALFETSFLNTKPSDRNTRRNRGRHGRRERWKRRVRRYRTFDASLYDQATYDFLTLEDLNYGFDRFWLRRKIRNHRVRFRFFPGPWMRSFKKQLSRPRLESFMGPRVEFFRILFEQAYHPEFHEFSKKNNILKTNKKNFSFFQNDQNEKSLSFFRDKKKSIENDIKNTNNSIYWNPITNKKEKFLQQNSTLRKFVRKVNNRIQIAKMKNIIKNPQNFEISLENSKKLTQSIFSKDWKSFSIFENEKTKEKSKTFKNLQLPFFKKSEENFLFQRFYKKNVSSQSSFDLEKNNFFPFESNTLKILKQDSFLTSKIVDNHFSKHLSKKDRFLERYKIFLYNTEKNQTFKSKNEQNTEILQNESYYRPITLLHPLKFYFQKEQALKRKFQFYGVKLFRNFHVENNAPYFRVMMKKFFYYYKPSLRWERTMRVATMRKARRKSSRIQRKLNIQKTSQILANTENLNFPQKFDQNETQHGKEFFHSNKNEVRGLQDFDSSFITKPSHFYSLVEKRASRYRYQIYKDVLQHWYYSPLNRLLLKLDIDSFIRRQPNSYFLTKNDEKFLHLKRQLLTEYYETLRWYTYMQHFSTMKNQIGGTKSLSNRAYNQQFMGTFKKIRHLFNITPSLSNQNVLKFDQPLYNEYTNNQKNSIFYDSVIHEELFADDLFVFSPPLEKNINFSNQSIQKRFSKYPNSVNNESSKNAFNFDKYKLINKEKIAFFPEDLANQSAKILREYLQTATPIRQNYISTLLNEKNYWELTKFLFRGQKIRGTNPITNETELFNQEKNYLLNSNIKRKDLNIQKFKEEIWTALLLKCQKKLYDQESLKNYVTLKKEKYENQKQKHEKYLKNRLERLKKSFALTQLNNNSNNSPFDSLGNYTSSIQKAMKESIFWQKNSFSKKNESFPTVENFFTKKSFLQKTNIRNNRSAIHSLYLNQDSQILKFSLKDEILNPQKMKKVIFQNMLKTSVKNRVLEIVSAESVFSKNLSLKKDEQKPILLNTKPLSDVQHFFWTTLRMKNLFSFSSNETKTNKNFKENKSPFYKFKKLLKVFSIQETTKKDLEFWKKRENALSKRRKIRKTLKRLRTQSTAAQKILFANHDFYDKKGTILSNTENKFIYQQNNSKLSRQKTDLKQETNINKKNSWKNYYFYEPSDSISISQENKSINVHEKFQQKKSFFEKLISSPLDNLKIGKKYFEKKFVRKRSRLRRYSSFKGRGPIKKRTLREKLKRQFKSLKKYGTSREKSNSSQIQLERETKKMELIQLITKRNSILPKTLSLFVKRDQKQRRTRQIKYRAWKKKKQNFAQKRRKLRKRRRSTSSKIRVFNKKLQRILSKKEIQTWWWQTFFPNFQAITEKNWQLHKNMQIRKQFFELSEKDILERDKVQIGDNQFLQIGDKDYKPLAIPEALRIREQLAEKKLLRFQSLQTSKLFNEEKTSDNIKKENSTVNSITKLDTSLTSDVSILTNISSQNINSKNDQKIVNDQNTKSFLEKFTANISIANKKNNEHFFNLEKNSPKLLQNNKLFVGTNPIPFYAGWDESLRKFVITNRLLSRKTSFSYSQKGRNILFSNKINKNLNQSLINNNSQNKYQIFKIQPNFMEFTKAPLQGMNAATTLYWQIPFTTYDPDQFFALGMDGFSPLGWRNFSFKHSKQTTKPILVKNFFSWNGENIRRENSNFSKNLFFKFFENTQKTKLFGSNFWNMSQKNFQLNEFEKQNNIDFSTQKTKNFSKTEIDKNFAYRRILKKQKRIKKHPRPPVWFPSGSLAQQVLPVHYIYVFYKRSRLPRDRYIRRRLQSTFLSETFSKNQNRTKILDFTLRKRVKPRRKYHRKRFLLETNMLVLRRRKFRSFVDENYINRPSSKIFSLKQEKRTIQSKQRRKMTDSKQANENLRIRQLRRRVQRQVFRPIWRYRPRSGGFVWPGDYLHLELVKAPFLNSTTLKEISSSTQVKETSTRKMRKKKRRTIQEWQIQQKKYLLEKHNLKVLKKRLEKSIQNLKL